jgi:GABA(A) receptor-associated protein
MSTDFEKKYNESKRVRDKYPERIPVIVGKAKGCNLNDIDKKKYLVPCDLTIGQFISIIRQRIKLSPDKAIFIFINNIKRHRVVEIFSLEKMVLPIIQIFNFFRNL